MSRKKHNSKKDELHKKNRGTEESNPNIDSNNQEQNAVYPKSNSVDDAFAASTEAFAYDNLDEEEEEKKISAYYYYRRIKKNKLERKARQNQRAFNRLRVLLRLATLVLLVMLGYKVYNMQSWYINPNIFLSTQNNKYLEIVNNRIVPQNKILGALRKTSIPHVPIYRFETDEIKQSILDLGPIKDVFVRRFWFPARLQIIIEEKTPLITIAPAENTSPVAFFTDDGSMVGREYLPLNPQFKTVRVLSYGPQGDDYRHWKLDKIKQIVRLAKIIQNYSKDEVWFVDMRNPRDVYVRTKTVNIRIGLLDDSAFERAKRISSILPQVKMLDKPIKYVDLRWNDTNYIKLGV